MFMSQTLEEYKKFIKQRLEPISDILAHIAAGDFSKKLDIPAEDDEFTELYVGFDFMMEDLQEHLTERKRVENIISRLYDISEVVSSEANLDQLFKAIHKHLGTIVNTTNFFIGLYDKKSDLISFPYFADEKDNKFVILRVSESGSLSSEVIKTRKPLIIKKEEFKKRLVKEELQLWGTLPEVWLGVPLKIKDDIIGVLGMQSYTDPNLYTEKDIALMESISDQIAIAIDHKKKEEDLKESEEKWRSVVENAPDIIMTVDREGAIQFINVTVPDLKMEEVVGSSIYDYIESEHHNRVKKYLKRIFRTGKPIAYQVSGVGPKGTTSWYESRIGPIKHDGKVVAATIITTDITKRKQAEEELEKHRKNLEDMVKERTEELIKANELLLREVEERKHAEVALRESEEKYRHLVERANDGITIIQDFELKYINPALASMLGYSPDEMIGTKFMKYIVPDELPKIKERYERRMKGEKVPPVYETKAYKKNGELINIELNAGLIQFEGEPADLVFARDIGERKRAEEELKISEKRYRSVFENVSDVIFTVNSDFVLSSISPTVEDMSGYKPEDLIGTAVEDLDFLTPESLERALGRMELILAGKDIGYQEYEFKAKDGTKRLVEVSYTPLYEKGEFNSIICVARDITERKLAEEKLRESEELYKSLVKTLPDAVTSTDLEGKITYVSPRTLQIHGFDHADEILGKGAFELIHPDYRETAVKNLQRTLTEGFVRNLEYTLLKKDGTPFTGLLSAALIRDAHGNPKSFIATTKDITERKIVEEQIKASLEEKEVLLRELHHRVKNNIQVISSMLRLHTGHIEDKNYAESIKEIGNRIRTMSLIHEKLYQAKDLAHIDFKEYIKELVNNLFRFYGVNINKIRPKIVSDGISLDIDTGIPCGLIINELVSNSLKHAFPDENKGGEILIEIQQEDKDKYALVVSDNGLGFPKELDFRNTDTLGLQLVNTLVAQLEGTIELNRKGKTEFKIVFQHEKKEVKANA
jgi:PAS domain S-box-containing protein